MGMMAKSIDQQIKAAMAKKVVGQTTEIYKGVVLELYKRITANSLQVGIAYGSPVKHGQDRLCWLSPPLAEHRLAR
jgi:hypothetical protein